MQREVFGRKGDFVTSPEISPLFGEHLAFWCILTWEQLGCPETFHLIELGPGTGKLMSDMLRIAARKADFYRALHVHLVDVSPALKHRQATALGCVGADGTADTVTPEFFLEHEKRSQAAEAEAAAASAGATAEAAAAPGAPRAVAPLTLQIPVGPKVSWSSSLSAVEAAGPSLIVAHELFDALPVHQFVYTAEGWREQCVDMADGTETDTPFHFRHVVSPNVTPALAAYLGMGLPAALQSTPPTAEAGGGRLAPDADGVLRPISENLAQVDSAVASLRASAASSTQVYQQDTATALLSGQGESHLTANNDLLTSVKAVAAQIGRLEQSTASAEAAAAAHEETTALLAELEGAAAGTYAELRRGSQQNASRMVQAKVGDVIEFSPSAAGLGYEIASRIALHGGAALLIDYGYDHASGASVRGIKDHKFVSPLAYPGETDLSVDVDFSQLRTAATTAGGVHVAGPVSQGEFLQRLGLVDRLQQILDSEGVGEEDKEAVMSQVERLVSPDAMGEIYKVMAFVSDGIAQELLEDGVPGFPSPAEQQAAAAQEAEATSNER